jgi:hypothetical protein
MTTIATFTLPPDAHLLQMRLGSVGIEAFVQDENFVQMDMLYSNVVGGVRVQVADEDVPAVREFLAGDAGLSPEAGELRCPKCGSTAIETERFSKRFAFLTMMLLMIPLLFFRRRLRCAHCLHTWRP